MRTRPPARALRTRTQDKSARRLAIEPLETRRLLASFTSQLPPIVISVGAEPVQIRQDAAPTKEITLPSAAVSALEELALLQHVFFDLNRYRDDDGLLDDLRQAAWSPAAKLMEGESFERLELEAAVEIAARGFELVSSPPELATERIFGPSLSETKVVSRTINASDASTSVVTDDVVGNETPRSDLIQPTVDVANLGATSTNDIVSEAESEAENGVKSHDTTYFVAEANHREGEIDEVARRPKIDDEDSEREEDTARASKTNDMLLLPQPPTGQSVTKESDTDRPVAESQASVESNGSGISRTGETVLEQMLLLPMVPDSGLDHESFGPTLIAGFNPVAMLQIFVGSDLGDMRYEEVQPLANVPPGVRVDEVASLPLVRRDRLAAAVFVIVVGYWYFHPGVERTLLAAGWNPPTGDRGAGGLRTFFGRG